MVTTLATRTVIRWGRAMESLKQRSCREFGTSRTAFDLALSHPTIRELTPEPEVGLRPLSDRLVPPTELMTKIIAILGKTRPDDAACRNRAWLWQRGRLGEPTAHQSTR